MDWSLPFAPFVMVISAIMLVWACIEVGSNDAANLINAVFGSRVLRRRQAVNLAGFFVILGAAFASPVLDTVRRGIFDFSLISEEGALSIFIATYLVNTLLLNAYSSFGLPVSSTVILVFSLAGGAIAVGEGFSGLRISVFERVVLALGLSIIASGLSAFTLQRIFRHYIRKDCSDPERVNKHGGWIAGLIFTSLTWFLLLEGLKNVSFIHQLREQILSHPLWWLCLPSTWAFYSILTHVGLRIGGTKASDNLFKLTAVLAMCSLAFSFGQNDLGNCASPGLAIFLIWRHGLETATQMQIPFFALVTCGFLLYLGMRTRRAQRVTRAEINTASQQAQIKLYAPRWCCALARIFLKYMPTEDEKLSQDKNFSPEPLRNLGGKKFHYDPLRASVMLTVNSSVIAFASGLGLPISATYVGFFAVLATGWGDKVFTRGQSDLKLGRAIWVFFTWLSSAITSLLLAGALASFVFTFKSLGLIICLIASILLQWVIKHRSDHHERVFHKGF